METMRPSIPARTFLEADTTCTALEHTGVGEGEGEGRRERGKAEERWKIILNGLLQDTRYL